MIAIAPQEERSLLESKLIDLAFRKVNFSVVSALLLAALVVVALWPIIEHGRLLAWLAAIAVIMVLHIVFLHRYMRLGQAVHAEPGKWKTGFVIGGAAAGLCWGGTIFYFPSTPFDPLSIFGVFVFPSTPFDPVTVLVIFVLAGVTAYASVALAPVPMAAMVFLICAWVPQALWLFSFGERMYIVMGLITLSYLGVMLMLSRQMYATICSLISVSDENRGLISTLRENDLRMSRFFESAPGFFYTAAMSPEGESSMPFASGGIGEMFGVPGEKVADSLVPLFELMHRDDVSRLVESREQSRRNLSPLHIEFRIIHPENGERWIELRSLPQREQDGSTIWHGFMHDITERQAMEAARKAALAEAQRLAQMRSAFLAQMSHELRTPLNGILGHTQNLLLDSTLSDKLRMSLSIIQHSGDHLLGLLNDVLDHAKIEADKLELNVGDVRLDVLLRAVTELMQARAEQKKLEFVCRLEAGLPVSIRGDGQRLRQVLLNLLSNAVKFTDRGQLSLRVSQPAPARIRFEVRDSGIGIAANKLEAIFLPFEQTGEIRRRAGGTGLGLAISRKLVRLMGGDIAVESRPGEGSLFAFELDAEILRPETLDVSIGQKSVKPQAAVEAPMITPPMHELESLYELAMRGNMRSIEQRAAYLAGQDGRYASFAEQLSSLAKSYQSKAVLQFVEQFLAGKACVNLLVGNMEKQDSHDN